MAINYCNQDIKGTLTTTGTITSGGSIYIPDYIIHTGDADTKIGFNTNDNVEIRVGGNLQISASSSRAYLRYQGSNKLQTDSAGVNVTGGVTATGNIVLDDGSGASPNIQFQNEDDDSWYIYNDSNGKFQVQQSSTIRATFSSSDLELANDLKVSGGGITLLGTGRIQGIDTVSAGTDAASKTYVDNAVSGAGSGTYLPLAGGTMTGDIAMGDNDITGLDKITFTDGIELFGATNNNYLKFKSLSTSNGGILFQDGDSTTQGYLYYDGGATSAIGFLSGAGEWAVRCIENSYVELRHNNSTKFQTSTTGVTITGTATATTFSGDLNGTINTATTATTQSASDNSTKVATTAYVDTAVSNAPQGTVTSVGATAPVQSTGGTTPVISVDTAAVSSASSKLATGAQIQTAIESSVSGSANRVAKFTADHVVGNSEIVDTGTSITMGKDASAASTLYLDTDNRKVGFRTETPGSAFDVNGTTRVRNQLNVGHTTEQNLYVDGDGTAGGRYVKMGNYGSGNYFGITSSENQPKYCASFGSAGKIVEDMRIVTIKLSGNAFKLLKTTGTTLLAAPGSNSFIIPYECIIHNSGGTSGNWNSTSSTTAAIGFCDNATCNYPGQFNRLFVINNTLLNTNAAWYYAAGIATTGKAMALNKALLLKASQDITTAPTGSWYIQIRYQVMNKDSGLVNNVDITKTTN
jgi:cytoskeletal protein RodZ